MLSQAKRQPPATSTDKASTDASWAWSEYWKEEDSSSRCLANAPADVRSAVDGHWARFAVTLRPSSTVLDLGCGAGIVGRTLLANRGDLAVTGIDSALVPPSADRRVRLLSRTAMEDLPFRDQTFDSAVSQFGIEYARVGNAARELHRVLRPGARFSFIVHHSDSLVVRGDRSRGEAILDVLGRPVELAFLSGDPTRLDRELGAVRGMPHDVLVSHVANALRSNLGRPSVERTSIWAAVAEALRPEGALVAALADACVAPRDIAVWTAVLGESLKVSAVAVLARPNGEIIGWVIDGSKPFAC